MILREWPGIYWRCSSWNAGCHGRIYFLRSSFGSCKDLPTGQRLSYCVTCIKEPAAHMLLKELGKEAIIHAGMCLGEGTGAVALFPMIDLSCAVYNSMSTFGDINVEQYEELK